MGLMRRCWPYAFRPRASLALLLALSLALGACTWLDTQPPPQVVVPDGVQSIREADEVIALMLAEIASDEAKLGRALAPARIIRVQLLRPGEMYELRHLDGTNPSGSAMGPNEGPGWMVEAIGTFIEDHPNGQITARGTHGFHRWDDAGGEGWGFIPCWTQQPMPAEEMEGTCP